MANNRSTGFLQQKTMSDETPINNSNRNVPAFNKVDATGRYDFAIRRGSPQRVGISGSSVFLSRVKTETRDSTLIVTLQDESSIPQTERFGLVIVTPDLDSIKLAGNNNGSISEIETSDFILETIGSGRTSVSGKAARAVFANTGTSDNDCRNVTALNADVDLKGSGKIQVTVKQTLSAKVFGNGEIHYYGNPVTVNKQVFGVGKIVKH